MDRHPTTKNYNEIETTAKERVIGQTVIQIKWQISRFFIVINKWKNTSSERTKKKIKTKMKKWKWKINKMTQYD